MTFSILTPDTAAATWERARRRVLISGSPNSGKTTSLRTWPTPIAVVVAPGEKGSVSLAGAKDVTIFESEPLDPTKPQNWSQLVSSIESITSEIIVGKHGKFSTLALDGLHKVYACILAAVTAGASARGEDFDAKMYSTAHTRFFALLDRLLRSPMGNVVATVWNGREKDDVDDKSANASHHVFPELPGRASKQIMGEFAVVLGAEKTGQKYVWLTKPNGRVWGAGVKTSPELVEKVPLFVPQDWQALDTLLAGTKSAA